MGFLSSDARQRLVGLRGRNKLLIAFAADILALLVTALLLATTRPQPLETAVWLGAHIPFAVAALYMTGVYGTVVRFIDLRFVYKLTGVIMVVTAVGGMTTLMFETSASISLVLIYGWMSLLALILVRVTAQKFLRVRHTDADVVRVLIYGAGDAGVQLASALEVNCHYRPLAFIDDSPTLIGRSLLGLRVRHSLDIARMKADDQFDQILLAIPSASRIRRKNILETLQEISVKVLVMPGIEDLASGAKRVDDLREVQIEDLLARDPVVPDPALLDQCIRGKVVLITGAGGSIGSELCRQVVRLGARKLVMFELSEYALYGINEEFTKERANPTCQIVPVLGSVLDRAGLDAALTRHGVQTIYHAAAYKHVPLVEQNALYGVRNNVIGTLNTVQAAIAKRIEHFVMISTDKAVRPTSVMGASKRVSELIVQALAEQNPQIQMSMVRFGNVLGSSGSVVPLFRRQIAAGGPVTVTDPEVTRYFMTISEAAQLVIQAGSMGRHGEVFVLDMGQPVKIRELAERMIRLSGLHVRDPETDVGDIEIQYSGLRPGEKLYEELLLDDNASPSSHPSISRAREDFLSWSNLLIWLSRLSKALDRVDVLTTTDLLKEIVAGYAVHRPKESSFEESGSIPIPCELRESRGVKSTTLRPALNST